MLAFVVADVLVLIAVLRVVVVLVVAPMPVPPTRSALCSLFETEEDWALPLLLARVGVPPTTRTQSTNSRNESSMSRSIAWRTSWTTKKKKKGPRSPRPFYTAVAAPGGCLDL